MPESTVMERVQNSPGGEERAAVIAEAPSGEKIAAACFDTMDHLFKKVDEISSLLNPRPVFSKATPTQRSLIMADKALDEFINPVGVSDELFGNLLDSLIMHKLCVEYASPGADTDLDPRIVLAEICMSTLDLLLEKNTSYGDSALNPTRYFSEAGPVEQIYIRLEDKLNRLQRGRDYPGDSDIDDIIGYLVLRKVAVSVAEDTAIAA